MFSSAAQCADPFSVVTRKPPVTVKKFFSNTNNSSVLLSFQLLFRAAFVLLDIPTFNFTLRFEATVIENNGMTLQELMLTEKFFLTVSMLD